MKDYKNYEQEFDKILDPKDYEHIEKEVEIICKGILALCIIGIIAMIANLFLKVVVMNGFVSNVIIYSLVCGIAFVLGR